VVGSRAHFDFHRTSDVVGFTSRNPSAVSHFDSDNISVCAQKPNAKTSRCGRRARGAEFAEDGPGSWGEYPIPRPQPAGYLFTATSKKILTRKLLMNTNTESQRAVEQDKTRFPKLISNSASATLGMALMAVGLVIAVSRANAATTVSTADQDFMLAAAQGGMTEVKLGELAAQKGMRDDVKEFGQMMVKDHTAINDNLKSLAAQKGVTLPDSLDAKHQGMVDKMAALTGPAFDDAYIAGMIKAHKNDAKAFKAESAATQDADIKSFLDKSIPVVDEHLQRITAMKK
jgi:putative membrane protein